MGASSLFKPFSVIGILPNPKERWHLQISTLTDTYTESAELARVKLIEAIVPDSLGAGGRNLPAAIDDGRYRPIWRVPERLAPPPNDREAKRRTNATDACLLSG